MRVNYFLSAYSWVRGNIKIILTVSVLYLFFLIINIPANFIIPVLKLPESVKITAISGTVWSGKIKNMKFSGIDLGSVNWNLQPAYLLLGAVAADISMSKDQQHITSWVKLSSSGKVELEETRFLIDLASLQPLIYGMPFSYAGMASGYFPVSYFHKNNYVGFNGKLTLSNLEMISPQQQAFGGLDIELRAENDGLTSGRLKGTGDLLDITGQITLNKDGEFVVSVSLAAREKGGSLENVVSFLGPKDAAGRIQLNNQLKLWH
ncbi:MAG: type II secretion system protein N [Gammaproteobacteria bacterium]|nr:type II secretion system protein N [Gammaproteobacteria bacterium]